MKKTHLLFTEKNATSDLKPRIVSKELELESRCRQGRD